MQIGLYSAVFKQHAFHQENHYVLLCDRGWDETEGERKIDTDCTWACVSCLEGDQKTETQEFGSFFQTNRITVEIIGFVITKNLSLQPALYPLQTYNLDKQKDGH